MRWSYILVGSNPTLPIFFALSRAPQSAGACFFAANPGVSVKKNVCCSLDCSWHASVVISNNRTLPY